MMRVPSYDIRIIDLLKVGSVEALHTELSTVLQLPSNYEKNLSSFRDAITGTAKMPDNLIIYNHRRFSKMYEKEIDKFDSVIYEYNKQMKRGIILFDQADTQFLSRQDNNIGCIFREEPGSFGLRGDDWLWKDLESVFSKATMPKDEKQLVKHILNAIEILTGHSVKGGKDFFVKQYDKGGMSSGYVSHKFWLERGIPLLVGRYKMMNRIV